MQRRASGALPDDHQRPRRNRAARAGKDLRQFQRAAVKAGHHLQRAIGNPGLVKCGVNQGQFVRHHPPRRRRPRRGDIAHRQPARRERLGNGRADIVIVKVKDRDRTLDGHPGRDILGGMDAGRRNARDRDLVGAEQVGRPPRPRRHHHMIRAELQHIPRRHLALREQRNIRHLPQPPQPVVHHPEPFPQARQPAFPDQPPAKLPRLVGDRDLKAAPRQRQRRLQPRRTRAHDQNRPFALRPRHLGMPAAPPLFAHGRVLRAAHPDPIIPRRDADVAADAFADLVLAPLVDLAGQEGVGNRRPRPADQVQHPAPDHRHHRIGRGKAAHADHRLVGDGLDKVDQLFMAALGGKARRGTVGDGIIHFHVKEIRRVLQVLHHLMRLGLRHLRGAVAQLLQRGAQRHGTAPMGGLAHRVYQLLHQPHPVAHRPAIGIGAVVAVGHEESVRQITHAGIDIKNVKARPLGPHRGLRKPADQGADVAGIHHLWALRRHITDMGRHPRDARG